MATSERRSAKNRPTFRPHIYKAKTVWVTLCGHSKRFSNTFEGACANARIYRRSLLDPSR